MNKITCLNIGLGEDGLSRTFNWYNDGKIKEAYLKYADNKTALINDVDEGIVTVKGTVTVPFNNKENVSCKAKINNLEYNKTYYYKVGSEEGFEEKIYSFKTRGKKDALNFAVITDLHMKDTETWSLPKEEETKSIENWKSLINAIKDEGCEFIISLGDNTSSPGMRFVEKGENLRKVSEKETELLFLPDEIKSIPFATINGNHECTYYDTENDFAGINEYHFSLPHDDGVTGHYKNHSSGNFWYRAEDVLIIGMNLFAVSNGNIQDASFEKNEKYIENAISKNPDCKWKILLNHLPTYTCCHGFVEENMQTISQINRLSQKFNIDAVLTGHSHAFSVSYEIKNSKVVGREKVIEKEKNFYISENPSGTVHINVPSAMDHSFYAPVDYTEKYLRTYGLTKEATEDKEFHGMQYSSPMYMNVTAENNSLTFFITESKNRRKICTYKIIKKNFTNKKIRDIIHYV